MTLTLSPPEATSRTKERDTPKTNVWLRGRMAWALLGLMRPGAASIALPQAAVPWGKTQTRWVWDFTASGDKDSHFVFRFCPLGATQPTLAERPCCGQSSCMPQLRVRPRKSQIPVKRWKFCCFIRNCYSVGKLNQHPCNSYCRAPFPFSLSCQGGSVAWGYFFHNK